MRQRARFTRAQRIAFETSTNPDVVDLRGAFYAAGAIGLDDPVTLAGLRLLVATGIIAESDIPALLVDRRPEERPHRPFSAPPSGGRIDPLNAPPPSGHPRWTRQQMAAQRAAPRADR